MKKLFLSFAMLASISLCIAQTSGWQTLGDTVVYTNAKVGINTSEPKEALHVNGYARGNGGHGAFQIRTLYGITAIGADSPGYSHFDTNKDRFYFTKPIMVAGGCISSSHDTNLRLQTFYFDGTSTNPTTRMTILNSNGYVGIGTTSPKYKLDVSGKIRATDSILGKNLKVERANVLVNINCPNISTGHLFTNTINAGTTLTISAQNVNCSGKIRATEIIVNTSGADFVLDKNYELRSLDDVNSYIQENQHLPEIPSAKQMQEEGMSVDQMVVKLLQKVEELTLYTIQQEERIKELEKNPK
ncbi:MAG: hypothetical protein J5823_03510 [Paludibacteraceae bacterium]|nr:hypothetical protein [Paludibacteraceae bacterium]